MAKQQPSTVYMEACYSSHYWGRLLTTYGHHVKLIPAQHVTPFVRGNKNDHNDALAIAEAAQRPHLRFVPVKSKRQQEILAMHRMRERLVNARTRMVNQLRGLLSDFGVIFPQGIKQFKKALISLLSDNQFSPDFTRLVQQRVEEFSFLEQQITDIEAALQRYVEQSEQCKIVRSIPGIGLINASAFVASIDKGQAFNSPKEFAVWLGLTPRQSSSGLSSKSMGISKRGDGYLRKQLIHGARAAIMWARKRDDALSQWIKQIVQRLGSHKAIVAVAHKMARLMWILLQRQQCFKPQFCH